MQRLLMEICNNTSDGFWFIIPKNGFSDCIPRILKSQNMRISFVDQEVFHCITQGQSRASQEFYLIQSAVVCVGPLHIQFGFYLFFFILILHHFLPPKIRKWSIT